jgi:hypothetical protein
MIPAAYAAESAWTSQYERPNGRGYIYGRHRLPARYFYRRVMDFKTAPDTNRGVMPSALPMTTISNYNNVSSQNNDAHGMLQPPRRFSSIAS